MSQILILNIYKFLLLNDNKMDPITRNFLIVFMGIIGLLGIFLISLWLTCVFPKNSCPWCETNPTPIPTGTPSPTGMPSPTGTTIPTGTPSPTGMPSPTATTIPTGTPSPTGTTIPTGTPSPTGTTIPTGTPNQSCLPLQKGCEKICKRLLQ